MHPEVISLLSYNEAKAVSNERIHKFLHQLKLAHFLPFNSFWGL
jgi:hypothetical protein